MAWDRYEMSGDDEVVLGLDELLGYEEILGAVSRRGPAALSRIAQAKQAGGVVVRRQQPTTARELPLGFDSVTNVTKATSARITSRPQKTFRPDRLVVANAIAGFFLIDSLQVGTDNMLVSADSIPAEAFSNLSVGVGLKMATANIGIDITLSVTNIDAAADHRFNGMLIGPAV